MRKSVLILCLVLSCAELFAGEKFLPPPTVNASGIEIMRDGNALHINWTNGNGARRIIVMRAGAAVTSTPINGIDYNESQIFGSGDVLNAGEYVVFDGTDNLARVFSLVPGTTYHITIFEYNGSGATTDYLVPGAAVANATTYSAAPTVQASNVNFTNVGPNSITVNWTSGNGSGALVVMRSGSAVNGSPTNLSAYASNSIFGSGFQVSPGNYAVYQTYPGLTNTVTVTNLTAGITYHVAVFELNGLIGAFFNTTNPARANLVTPNRPTIPPSNLVFSATQGGQFNLDWTNGNGARRLIIARAGSPVTAVPIDGVTYTGNPDFSTATEIAPGEKILYTVAGNSLGIIGLQPNTTYHFRIYEYLGTGGPALYLTSSFAVGSHSTLSPPTVQSANITFPAVTSSNFNMEWTSGNGASRIILAKAGAPVDANPVDLQRYTYSDLFSVGEEIGTGNFVVYAGVGSAHQVSNLQPGTTYHLSIYELNGTTGPVYNTVNPARGSITTPARPTIPASLETFSQIEGNSMRLDWFIGNGLRRLIVARAGSPVTAEPVDGVTYAANRDFRLGQEVSPGQVVVYDGSGVNNESIFGLTHSTAYHFRIYEYSFSGSAPIYLTSSFGSGFAGTIEPPVAGPSGISFNSVTNNSVNVEWNGGSGSSRILIVRQGAPVNEVPANYTSYTANEIFGSGDQVGNGNYVVYKGGIDNNQTITNLQQGTTYHFALYDLNGLNGPVYLTPGFTASVTIRGAPQEPSTSVRAENITSNSLTIRWTSGSGNGRLVLMSESTPVSSVPQDNVEYTADNVFGDGSELRTTAGNFAVYNGAGNEVTVTGLRANSTYYFTVYEYNRFGGFDIQYLTSSSGSATASTPAALPVTWVSFDARLNNDKVMLDWTTAQETNSQYYSVEKSSDGNHFTDAGSVQAAGNSFNPVNYQFIDDDPIDGNSYYRLKQVDMDGKFAYSKTLTIQYKAKRTVKKIINPFSHSLFVQFTPGIVPAGTTWRLLDMQGRMVLSKQTTGNIINEPMNRIQPGIYFLEIMVRGKRQTIKLMKN